jgi:SAM-dependent methyltransferase
MPRRGFLGHAGPTREDRLVPIMSKLERSLCDSAPWRTLAQRVILPWVLPGRPLLEGAVLEIGCGSGAMAQGMVGVCPGITLMATDVDPVMVLAARRRLAAHEQVDVEVADVTALPFADTSFDAVTSFLMLHHVIEWPAALEEAARVLRDGGLLLGYDLTDTRLARWIHRLDGSPHLLVTPDELCASLVTAGFSDIRVVRSAFGHVMRFRARKATVGSG